jgi:hypothetical protein
MCIHKCYIFQCDHFVYAPGALIVCDLATVAALTPPFGSSRQEESKEAGNVEKRLEIEAATIPLPRSPEPSDEKEEMELKTEWPEIKGFSGICTPMAHGYTTYNIERLCKDCQIRRGISRVDMEAQMAEARRDMARLSGEYSSPEDSDSRSLV